MGISNRGDKIYPATKRVILPLFSANNNSLLD